MLSPTDVRAGNWVLKIMGSDRDNEPFIEYKALALEEHSNTFSKDCFPIPLSFVILGYCGFTLQLDHWYKYLERKGDDKAAPVLKYENENRTWYVNDFRVPAQPLYVHQLQNLWYALTGQELMVNLGLYINLPLFGPITFFNRKRIENNDQELL